MNGTNINDLADLEITIKNIQDNSEMLFKNKHPGIQKLKTVDDIFRKALQALYCAEPRTPTFFALRAHGSFIAAIRLISSGQVTEAQPVLRQCLENGMYALHMYRKYENRLPAWWGRDESPKNKQAVRSEFSNGKILKELKADDPKLGRICEIIYERTIDYGAHPNPGSRFGSTHVEMDGENARDVKFLYTVDFPYVEHGLKACAEVAVTVLNLISKIYPVRFQLAGLDTELDIMSRNL